MLTLDFIIPVSDEAWANAYEQTNNQERATIKTSIAISRAIYGEQANSQAIQTKHLGFKFNLNKAPAPWVLCLINGKTEVKAALASALATARFAKADNIFVIFLSQPAHYELCSLELCGISQAYITHKMPENDDWNQLFTSLLTYGSQGCIMLFGDFSEHISQLYKHDFPIWNCPKQSQASFSQHLQDCAFNSNLKPDFFHFTSVHIALEQEDV